MNASYLLPVLLAACGGANDEPQQHLPRPTTPTFTLFVSNQSFDLPTVDIEVKIDNKLAVTGDFDVEGQHTWVKFDFGLTPGPHHIYVASEAGGVSLDKTFVMDDRKWAVVSFWYYAAGSPEPTPQQLSFDLMDDEPAFQ